MFKKTNKSIISIIIFLLFISNIFGITSQAGESITPTSIKNIIHRDEVELTAYRIETDMEGNYIVIYGNTSTNKVSYSIGPDSIYISKFDKFGQLIWNEYLTNNFWSFGIHDLQIDSLNNIHIISYHHGWCGVELASFEYTKISTESIQIFHERFTGKFIQMSLYMDNSVGILYKDPYYHHFNEDYNGIMDFLKISNKIDISITKNVTFNPRGFLIENPDSIIILSESSWRLFMSGRLVFISDLVETLLDSSSVIVYNNIFILNSYYETKVLKLSPDYKYVEYYKTLFLNAEKSQEKMIFKFDNYGIITFVTWNSSSMHFTQIDPLNNYSNSTLVNIENKIFIDFTFTSKNTIIFLLSDGDLGRYQIDNAKNIYIASNNINFEFYGGEKQLFNSFTPTQNIFFTTIITVLMAIAYFIFNLKIKEYNRNKILRRSEQVGDGQRRNAGLGEDEGKKGHTAEY